MRARRGCVPPHAFAVPEGLREVDFCQITYHRAVAGCPGYVEYFKPGDDVPGGRCPLHQGDVQQRVERAVERAIGGVWGKLKGIFR